MLIDLSDLISAWIVMSVFKTSVARVHPSGLDRAHTHPGLDHPRLLYKKSHAYNIDETKIIRLQQKN
jgi:hypothetical protein